MMMKCRRWIMLLLISAIVIISGCGTVGDNIDLLQSHMLANGNQEELKKTLDELLPSVEYMTPNKSEQKQSIFIDDINQDGTQEAFVLYGHKRKPTSSFISSTRGQWKME